MDQSSAFGHGLTLEQVQDPSFNSAYVRAAYKARPYDSYKGLNHAQVNGVAYGLSRAQVEHDWFGPEHANAAKKGIPYEEYKELSGELVKRMVQEELTRMQLLTESGNRSGPSASR